MSTQSDAQLFEFEGFSADSAQRRLTDRDGNEIGLPSRAFDVLMCLLEHRGELVDKATLMSAVWQKTVVEEGNLTQCVFALRRALGESGGDHRFIVTVPGRGYQFVAPVQVSHSRPSPPSLSKLAKAAIAVMVSAAVAAGAWLYSSRGAKIEAASSPAVGGVFTIAILPFADLSADKDMEYFGDGLAEELIGTMAGRDNLRVIGRRSAFAFKGKSDDARSIGEKLKVAAILEGSVRKEADRVRITTQLTRTSDGVNLWAQNYDRRIDDILDVQDSIARDVVTALGSSIPPSTSVAANRGAERTRSPEAYAAYLRGQYFYGRRTTAGYERAREEFSRAIAADPGFALAHAWLARSLDSYAERGVGDAQRQESQATASLDRALKLDPAIADIWWVNSQFFQGHNAPLALRISALERARALTPNDPDVLYRLSNTYFQQGNRAQGFEAIERAYQIDPLWPLVIRLLAVTEYSYRSNRQRALELMEELIALSPDDSYGQLLTAWVAMNEGRALDWDERIASAVASTPRDLQMHVYLATDYGDLRIWDAANHHARLARELAPESDLGWQASTHVLLLSGDISGARRMVAQAAETKPGDHRKWLAQADLQYFTGDCAGAIGSLLTARPALGQPAASLNIMFDLEWVPMLVWCQHQVGNFARARELVEVFDRVLAPPTCPGLQDGTLARVAAANGDRQALIKHLTRLANTRAVQITFAPHEPMIQPFAKDAEVNALLATIEARRAEWRRIIPKSSMRVPTPGARANR